METKYLNSDIPPLENEQINTITRLALQLQPYLTGVLSKPTESQGVPIHNMHSKQTLALADHEI